MVGDMIPKYRIWDKENREWAKDFTLTLDGGLLCDNETTWFIRENFELMQWTGLQDNNLQDIYQGDIIESNGKIYNIEFNMGSFLAFAENKGGAFDIYQLGSFKITGNKCENPELLEQK